MSVSSKTQEAQPPKQSGNLHPFTAVAHTLIDELWPLGCRDLSDKAKIILIAIVRWTDGDWHKKSVMLSVPDLMDLTGSTNKRTVEAALKELLDRGVITRCEERGQRGTFKYALNPRFSSGKSATADQVNEIPAVAEVPPLPVAEVPPLPVAEVPPLNDSEGAELPPLETPSAQSENGFIKQAKDSSKIKEKIKKDSRSTDTSTQGESDRSGGSEREKRSVLEEELEDVWGRTRTQQEHDAYDAWEDAKRAVKNARSPLLIAEWEQKRDERRAAYIHLKNASIRDYQALLAVDASYSQARAPAPVWPHKEQADTPDDEPADEPFQCERAESVSENPAPPEAITLAAVRVKRARDARETLKSSRLLKYASHTDDWWRMEEQQAVTALEQLRAPVLVPLR